MIITTPELALMGTRLTLRSRPRGAWANAPSAVRGYDRWEVHFYDSEVLQFDMRFDDGTPASEIAHRLGMLMEGMEEGVIDAVIRAVVVHFLVP